MLDLNRMPSLARLFARRPEPVRRLDIEAALRNARPPRDLTPERLAALQSHSKQFKEAQLSIAAADAHTAAVAIKALGLGRQLDAVLNQMSDDLRRDVVTTFMGKTDV